MSVPYLRVRNGRGKLYDDAEANRGAYIDKTSSASGFAKLRDCWLVNGSVAADRVQVYGGEFNQTLITGQTVVAGSPYILNSVVDCSEVSGRAMIHNARLLGMTEVCDSPVIDGVTLQDAIVYGDPTLVGRFEVSGRVHEGFWFSPPKHIKLPWCDLSECIDGKMLLNCWCRPVVWWLRFGPRIARKWEWSQDMIDVTLETIRREFYCQNDTQGILSARDTLSTVTA